MFTQEKLEVHGFTSRDEIKFNLQFRRSLDDDR